MSILPFGRSLPSRLLRCWLLWAVCAAAISSPCWVKAQTSPAQKGTVAPSTDAVTTEDVRNWLRSVEESSELDEAAKTRVRELYELVLAELESAAKLEAKATQFARDIESVAENIRRVKDDLDMPSEMPEVPQADSLVQLQEWLAEKEAELDQLQEVFQEKQREPLRRHARSFEIVKELSAARSQLTDINRQLKSPSVSDEPRAVVDAQHHLLLARRQALEQKIANLENERDAYVATLALLPLEYDLAKSRVEFVQQEVSTLQTLINERWRVEVERQVQDANQQLEQAPPQVTSVALENVALSEERKLPLRKIELIVLESAETERVLDDFRQQYVATREKIKAAGLSDAIGQLLRKQRAALPDSSLYRGKSRERQKEIQDVQQKLFELQDRRSDFGNLDAQFATDERSPQLQADIRAVLSTRRQYLDLLIADYNSYFYKLIDLDSTERQLISETEDYAHYINERIFWVRSAPNWITEPTRLMDDVASAAQAFWWLIHPEHWHGVGRALIASAKENAALTGCVMLLILLLLYYQQRMHKRVVVIGERAMLGTFHEFPPTLQALLLTILTAVPLPAAFWYLGWLLAATPEDAPLAKALGGGLQTTAEIFLLVVLLRQTCRAKGLAGAHFGWTKTDLGRLRKYLRWMMLLILPMVLVAEIMHIQETQLWRYSLGRAMFAVAMLVLSVFMHRLLRPRRGVLYQVLAAADDSWLVRLRYLWYAAAAGAPLMLAVLTILGYYYTAYRLIRRLDVTAWLLLGLLIVTSLLLRWILVNRRRIAIRQARERLAAAQREAQAAAQSPDSPAPTAPPAQPPLDLPTIDAQTRRLLLSLVAVAGAIGLWLIWIELLPAIGYLNQVELWGTIATTVQTTSVADGTLTTRTVERYEPVTLIDLAIAVLIVVMTFIVARNFPSLLELALPQRLPLDAAVRFTIGTVSRYVLVIVGIVAACNMLGIAWSKVHWLIAALTVGLGFGLQEIFANFVSGIIILIERPVRVGDLVTIGGVSGTVTRIQMRATTIRNFARRELLVPNKELVTGRVLNWTLTDKINRVVLRVGISYHSDPAVARDILLKIAQENPKVVDKPKPKAIFRAFGDSGLMFELRIYIADMDFWPKVVTDVNTAIYKAFREAGIVFAFPQRDVHIRTVTGSTVKVRLDGDTRGGEQEDQNSKALATGDGTLSVESSRK